MPHSQTLAPHIIYWISCKSQYPPYQQFTSNKLFLVFQKSFTSGHKYNWLGLFVGITLPKALPAWLGGGIRGQWIILREGSDPRTIHPSSGGHKYSGKAQSFVLLTKRLLRRREFCSQSRQLEGDQLAGGKTSFGFRQVAPDTRLASPFANYFRV